MSRNDIQQYRSLLRIQKHRLDDELEMQAELLQQISECVVIAKSDALYAKDQLDRLEGQLYSDAKLDYPKATVPELHGITMKDSDRIAAWQKYQKARHTQEDWEGLHEAWKSRGFALRALVDLRLANYYTSDSSGSESDYDRGRKALSEARRAAREPRRRASVD